MAAFWTDTHRSVNEICTLLLILLHPLSWVTKLEVDSFFEGHEQKSKLNDSCWEKGSII